MLLTVVAVVGGAAFLVLFGYCVYIKRIPCKMCWKATGQADRGVIKSGKGTKIRRAEGTRTTDRD